MASASAKVRGVPVSPACAAAPAARAAGACATCVADMAGPRTGAGATAGDLEAAPTGRAGGTDVGGV
ncbi:MAG: hypothetical protein ACJ8AW_26785 [Rhodopila sp.]